MLGFGRGDTIIEVLFAITVFSLVAVGGLTIMNQGTAVSQRALEITLARHEIDAQADALRFAHDAYVASQATGNSGLTGAAEKWSEIRTSYAVRDSASDFQAMTAGNVECQYELPNTAFVLDPKTLNVYGRGYLSTADARRPDTYSKVQYHSDGSFYDSRGLWVEAEQHDRDPSTNRPGYIDFHIRACWSAPGGGVPATLGTIVRLYEP